MISDWQEDKLRLQLYSVVNSLNENLSNTPWCARVFSISSAQLPWERNQPWIKRNPIPLIISTIKQSNICTINWVKQEQVIIANDFKMQKYVIFATACWFYPFTLHHGVSLLRYKSCNQAKRLMWWLIFKRWLLSSL